jgi:hypothetical protein
MTPDDVCMALAKIEIECLREAVDNNDELMRRISYVIADTGRQIRKEEDQ